VPAISTPVALKAAPAAKAAPTARRALRSRVAKLYTPSRKAEIIEFAAANGATAAAEKFGVSRYSIYDWHRRVRKAAAGQGPAPTSGPAPKDIEAQRDKEILNEWHQHPGLGPSPIVNQLRRRNVKVSVNTTRRVMEEAGYRPPKVKREPHDPRFEAVLAATDASRSRAYELSAELIGHLGTLARPVGRPPRAPSAPPSAAQDEAIASEVLRYLMRHPAAWRRTPSGSTTATSFGTSCSHSVTATRTWSWSASPRSPRCRWEP